MQQSMPSISMTTAITASMLETFVSVGSKLQGPSVLFFPFFVQPQEALLKCPMVSVFTAQLLSLSCPLLLHFCIFNNNQVQPRCWLKISNVQNVKGLALI